MYWPNNGPKPYNDSGVGNYNDARPVSRFPREWSVNTRDRGNIDGTSTKKQVNDGLSTEPSITSTIDLGTTLTPSNGNLWEGVFGGESDGSKKVQQKLDLVSRHIKLIYIYKIGPDLINYNCVSNNQEYPISNNRNFDNTPEMETPITGPITGTPIP